MDVNEALEKILKYSPESVYLYGSAIREDFNPEKSDLDFFIIFKENPDMMNLFINIKSEFVGVNPKVDVNICFMEEFEQRVHVDRPVSYYIGIKRQSKLLFGKDYLSKLDESELKPVDLYKRATNLSQRLRHSYLNDNNTGFWVSKIHKWLQTLVLEIIFLEGTFELNYVKGITKFDNENPRVGAKVLLKEKISIEEAIIVSENLKKYVSKGVV